jgi:hypothetical protein
MLEKKTKKINQCTPGYIDKHLIMRRTLEFGFSNAYNHILNKTCTTWERRTSLYVPISLKAIVNLFMTGPGKEANIQYD